VLQLDKDFRQCFWDLASVKEDVREKSTNDLVNILRKEQETSANDAKQLAYALTRLIRGLSSSRDGARQGFSVALTQVLRLFPSIKTSAYIKRVGEILPKNPNSKGKEEREINYGRIFSILVLARAGRFEKETLGTEDTEDAEDAENSSDTGSSDEEMKDRNSDSEESDSEEDGDSENSNEEEVYNNPLDWAVSNLHELSKRKEQYEQLCYHTTVEIFRQLSVPTVLQILETVHSSFFPPTKKLFTASQLYLAFVLEHEFEWQHPDGSVYTIDTLKSCSDAIVGTFSTHPEIHIVWKKLLEFCFPKATFDEIPPPHPVVSKPKFKKSNKGFFEELWNTIIEDKLFHSESHQKKYLGFQLAEQIISLLSPAQISLLFTQHFSQCIVNSLFSTKNFLYKAVSHFLQRIIKDSEKMPSNAMYALAMELLKLNRNFDGFSKSKTVENLVSQLELPEIQKYLTNLRTQFYEVDVTDGSDEPLDEEQTKAATDSQQIRAINRMLSLCRNAKNKDESYLCSVLHFFLLHGFFSMQSGSTLHGSKESFVTPRQWKELQVTSAPVTHKVTQQCRTALTSLFKEFATLSLSKEKTAPGEMLSGEVWPSYALRVYTEFASLKNTTELSPLSEEATEALESLQALGSVINKKISSLQSKIKSQTNTTKANALQTDLKIQYAFRLLAWNCAVMLHFESDTDIVEAMGDLKESYNHLISKKKGTDGPNPYDVVTDIIVSLLTRSSAYLRTVATRSFSLLRPTLPTSSVQILFDIIDPKEGKFEEYDDELSYEEDEEDDDGVPFTLEEAEAARNQDMEEDSDDSDDSDSDDDDDDDNPSAPIDEVLEKELLRLQQEDTNVEDIYIEDAPMEDLKKFNDRLQMMLTAMKKQARQSDEKRTMQIDHKKKILDLLETYLQHDPSNPIALNFLGPLFRAIVSAENNKSQLHYLVKLRHFAIHKFPRTKLAATDKNQAAVLIKLFEQISPFCVGKKSLSPATISVVHEYIYFLIKLLIQEGSFVKEIREKLVSMVEQSVQRPLKDFDWVLWLKLVTLHGSDLFGLAQIFVESFVVKTVKPFALGKGLEILDTFSKKHSGPAAESKEFIAATKLFYTHVPDLMKRQDIHAAQHIAILTTINSTLNTLRGTLRPKDIKTLVGVLNEGTFSKPNSQKIRSRLVNCRNAMAKIDPTVEVKVGGKRQLQIESKEHKKKSKTKSSEEDVSMVKKTKKHKNSDAEDSLSDKKSVSAANTPKKSKKSKK